MPIEFIGNHYHVSRSPFSKGKKCLEHVNKIKYTNKTISNLETKIYEKTWNTCLLALWKLTRLSIRQTTMFCNKADVHSKCGDYLTTWLGILDIPYVKRKLPNELKQYPPSSGSFFFSMKTNGSARYLSQKILLWRSTKYEIVFVA